METGALLIIAVIALLLVGVIVLFVYLPRRDRKLLEELATKSKMLSEETSRNILALEREQFERYFETRERTIKTQLDANEDGVKATQETIKSLIHEMRRELTDSVKKREVSEKQSSSQFEHVRTALEEYKVITKDLEHSTKGLRELLSNNKMRGRYGEEVAEDLLRSMGWVEGEQYEVNKAQDTQATRPDFTIKLPDGSKINVDAKFPFSALIRFHEATTDAERKAAERDFENDVKEKIKQCSSREYINPDENTVDFVVMFIPNEMIFSFIYDRLRHVWDDGLKKKVILAGPFSFTAILRMVYQSYEMFKYQKNLGQILGLIKRFELEFEKYSGKMEALGKTIGTLNNHYDELSRARTNQLQRVVDKIKAEDITALPEGDHKEE